jgi:hypothetical protein
LKHFLYSVCIFVCKKKKKKKKKKDTISELKDAASKSYVDGLMNPSQNPDGKGTDNGTQRSPIEAVFQKYTQQSLFSYEDYFQTIRNEFNTAKVSLKTAVASQLETISAKLKLERTVTCKFDSSLHMLQALSVVFAVHLYYSCSSYHRTILCVFPFYSLSIPGGS